MACPFFLLSRSIFQATSNRSRSSKPVSLFYPCRSSARGPLPQVPRWHPRVAKRASIGTLARRPCPQVSQWHPRVAKHSSDWSSARGPLPQVPRWHPRVAKGASIDTFGTATLPACTSELSPRGERPADRSMTSHLPITYRSLTGNLPML